LWTPYFERISKRGTVEVPIDSYKFCADILLLLRLYHKIEMSGNESKSNEDCYVVKFMNRNNEQKIKKFPQDATIESICKRIRENYLGVNVTGGNLTDSNGMEMLTDNQLVLGSTYTFGDYSLIEARKKLLLCINLYDI
jgi:hypothetical protein